MKSVVLPKIQEPSRTSPSPKRALYEQDDLRRILARDVARRFKRITGKAVVVTPMWRNRTERKAAIRDWADHPVCRPYQHERACIRCRLAHLRQPLVDETHPVHHRCAFGHTCVFSPLVVDGHCLAYCKLALDESSAVDQYVELLDVLAENAGAHLTAKYVSLGNGIDNPQSHENRSPELPFDPGNDGWSDVVHRAFDLIDDQYADPDLTVACVARRLGMNRDYLSHLFRVQTGQRMSRRIFLRRMQQARTLLLTTNLQVRRIALASGFLNTDWFSHTFHELEGVTPSQFRRNARRHAASNTPSH